MYHERVRLLLKPSETLWNGPPALERALAPLERSKGNWNGLWPWNARSANGTASGPLERAKRLARPSASGPPSGLLCIVHWQEIVSPSYCSLDRPLGYWNSLWPFGTRAAHLEPLELLERRRLLERPIGLLEPSGTPEGQLERAKRSQYIVHWQDGIAPYSISVLISIAQHMLFFSFLIDRLHTCCRLNADLMQTLRKIHLLALY